MSLAPVRQSQSFVGTPRVALPTSTPMLSNVWLPISPPA